VWLWAARTRPGRSPKIEAQRWTGPRTVEARYSDVVYKISREGQSPQVISVDRIRPYAQLELNRYPRDDEGSSSSSESSDSDDRDDEDVDDVLERPEVVTHAPDVREELSDEERNEEQLSDDGDVIHHTPRYDQALVTSRAPRTRRAPQWLQDYDRMA
jgi:hypothetical protein